MTASETMLGPQLDRVQRLAMLAGIVGVLLCTVGLFIDRAQFLRSYLWAYVYWNGLTVGSLGILLLHNVVGGRWGVVIRRLVEAGTRTLPLMLLLVVPIVLGMSTLYIWTWPDIRAHDPSVHFKTSYLNVPFFIVRIVIYFSIWMFWAGMLRRRSLEQDRTGDPSLIVRMRQISAPGLLIFVLTASFAFIDLVMSLEPNWFSTIYGAMFLIGQMLATFAFMIAILILLARQEPFASIITVQHFHDLGNLMFAFTVLWAYLSFSQFLIIWAGNLPEEIPWYLRRFSGGWAYVAVAIVAFHFCVPFVIMLFRFVKQNPNILYKVALWMIVVRMLDVFWVVEPAFYQDRMPLHAQVFGVSWMDLAAPLALGGIWVAAFIWHLKRYPLLPVNDPRLHEVPKRMVEGLQ